jgi:hypothetical protein
MELLPARLRVERLEDLLCCCVVLLTEPAPVLWRGVRGNIDIREEDGEAPRSDGYDRAGDGERNERLKPRKADGVWRIFEVRRGRARATAGVDGICCAVRAKSPSVHYPIYL